MKNFKLLITPDFQNQIDYLHKNIGLGLEWSGTLLYEVVGTLTDDNLVTIPRFIYLMDIGTASYTSYKPAQYYPDMDRVTDFITKGWLVGQIHTHHSMAAFFSGTDTNDLVDSVTNNFKETMYLSLIVNYAGTYCAKIGLYEELNSKFYFSPNSISNYRVHTIDAVIEKETPPMDNIAFLDVTNKFIEKEKAKKPIGYGAQSTLFSNDAYHNNYDVHHQKSYYNNYNNKEVLDYQAQKEGVSLWDNIDVDKDYFDGAANDNTEYILNHFYEEIIEEMYDSTTITLTELNEILYIVYSTNDTVLLDNIPMVDIITGLKVAISNEKQIIKYVKILNTLLNKLTPSITFKMYTNELYN